MEPSEIQAKGITEVRKLVAEYSFYVEEVAVQIQIKVWKTDRAYGGDWFTYTTSHSIHTPIQADPYVPSAPFAASEELAVEKAIDDIMTVFNSAVAKGHVPEEAWLVPND